MGTMPGQRGTVGRLLMALLMACAVARFAGAVYGGLHFSEGDFYHTFPGANVRTLNPTLWDSPDLAGSRSFHLNAYLYGPAQYLTLYPLTFLRSYREVANALLVVYAAVLAGAVWLVWRLLILYEPSPRPGIGPAVCAALLFAPLIQSYVQREFEIVVYLLFAAGTYLLAAGRTTAGAALFGYITWFKLLPLVFLPYFAMRRWVMAVVGFVAGTAVVLVLAHALFGLDRFLIFNPDVVASGTDVSQPATTQLRPLLGAAPTFVFNPRISPGYIGTGFCDKWDELNETMASVKWAICGLNLRHPWLPGRAVFYALVAAIALAFLLGFVTRSRTPASPRDEKWRIVWEVSLVAMAATLLIRAHYYYLIVLVLPLSALWYRYLLTGVGPVRRVLLAVAYVTLSAFVVPTSFTSKLTGVNVWHAYTHYGLYLYGELLLFGLVLWEYVDGTTPQATPAVP